MEAGQTPRTWSGASFDAGGSREPPADDRPVLGGIRGGLLDDRLDDLDDVPDGLNEVLRGTTGWLSSRDDVLALFDAVVPFSADLDLSRVLARIMRSACALVGARYGALGVLSPDGNSLSAFYTHGVTREQRELIGPLPTGHGILGLLIREPWPRRLHDIASHADAYGFPPNHPPMRTFLGAPIRIRDTIFGNIYLCEKVGGADFTAEDEQLVVALSAAAGVAIDNARLYDRSQARERWAEATSQLVQSLLESEDEEASLELMASRACENSGAVVVVTAVLDVVDRLEIRALSRRPSQPEPADGSADVLPAETAVVPTAVAAVPRAESEAQSTAETGAETDWSVTPADPTGTLLLGDQWTALLEAGQPLLHVPGGANDPRARPAVEARALLGLPGGAPVALVPLSAGRRALGLIIAAWPEDEELAAQDALPALAAFAIQAAVALSASRAHDDRARLALLEDRDRIARDMHDNVVQRLFSTGLSLQSAAPLAQHPVVRTRLNQAVSDLDSAIREIRQAIFALHTVDPVPSLVATLEALARSNAVSLGFTPQVSVEGRPDLAAAASSRLTGGWSTGSLSDSVSDSISEAIWASLRADILAVVREGLANIARHAGATTAQVLVVMGAFIDIYVTDNGSGTDPGAARSGLVNLRKRAEDRGGVLEVLTAEGGGTVLHWRVPVADESPEPHPAGRD